jgi:hypothetical protein
MLSSGHPSELQTQRFLGLRAIGPTTPAISLSLKDISPTLHRVIPFTPLVPFEAGKACRCARARPLPTMVSSPQALPSHRHCPACLSDPEPPSTPRAPPRQCGSQPGRGRGHCWVRLVVVLQYSSSYKSEEEEDDEEGLWRRRRLEVGPRACWLSQFPSR